MLRLTSTVQYSVACSIAHSVSAEARVLADGLPCPQASRVAAFDAWGISKGEERPEHDGTFRCFSSKPHHQQSPIIHEKASQTYIGHCGAQILELSSFVCSDRFLGSPSLRRRSYYALLMVRRTISQRLVCPQTELQQIKLCVIIVDVVASAHGRRKSITRIELPEAANEQLVQEIR